MRNLMFDAYTIAVVLCLCAAFAFTSDGVWDAMRFLPSRVFQLKLLLIKLLRMATLHRDELWPGNTAQSPLCNYLQYNLYDQAEKLRSKAPRFEAHSSQQFCRYLFYLGKIRTIQLEYTDAKESLLQAARKAPTTARGFRIQCKKWAIIVRLLLGEIPHRTVFMQKGMKKALTPYFELTNAERVGDLELFRAVADKFASTFSADNIFCILLMGYGSFVGYVLCNKI